MSNIEPTPFGDKYVLVEHIATGGMAEIYRANYSGIEGFAKELVIKRLREEFAERPDVVKMFLDEARVAATLTHNNVVHTYDLGEIGSEYFIAMELLKGEELVAVLRRAVRTDRMIPMDLAIGIIMQSLEGLHYAHHSRDEAGALRGLVHRDINPTNIHVGYDGLCKIVDFGIAATRTTALSGSGQFAGKLSYMAPEQVRGEPLDGRADLWAIGVVLYEMCLGKRLFRGKPDDVRRRVLEGDIPPPTFVKPDFPPALEAVIMQALEVDREARHTNADHMFRELEAFCQEAGLSWTPRKISAYMSEMFGEGAPAEVNYDDLYDDLVDEALDFDQYDRVGGGEDEDDAPDWVKSVERTKPKKGRKTMTIGNLDALVAEPAGRGPGDSQIRKQLDPNRASGRHKIVNKDEEKQEVAPEPRPAARSGSRPRARPKNATASIAAVTSDPGADASSFGQGVMSEQRRKTNPLVWIVVLVALAAIGYFVVSVFTQK